MKIVLTKISLEKYDTEKMFKIYDKWPDIAKKAYESNLKKIKFKKMKHIVFAGMGGSGTIGDFFASILSKTEIHTTIIKGYILPESVNSNTLVIISSVSGNTVETLEIIKKAHKKKCKIIAFSSGGKIEVFCKKKNIEFRKISEYNSPRASFVNYVYAMLKVLEDLLPVKEVDVINSIKILEKTRKNIYSNNLTKTNTSLEIAQGIKYIPIIYYPWGLQAAAIRFKNSLQENSKLHAIAEDVLESSHNGIVAWEKKSYIQPLLLIGINDNEKTIERWKIFEKYFSKNKIKYKKIISEKGDIITKLINLIYVLDYASIYLSVIRKIDPSPVKSIEFIKRNL